MFKVIKFLCVRKVFLLIALCFSLSFFSCDKSDQLERTTWIAKAHFYRVFDEFLQVEYLNCDGTINIEFSSKDANIEVSISDGYGSHSEVFAKGKGSYVCSNNKITIGVEWKDNWIDSKGGVKWEGTIKKNKMTLNISGEKIQFDRVY